VFTPEEVEGIIRDLGGVPVIYDRLTPNPDGLRMTFGRASFAADVQGDVGGTVRVPGEWVEIAYGRLESPPEVDDEIAVAGEARTVAHHERTPGGLRIRIELGGVL
jgi:hypothetical protein